MAQCGTMKYSTKGKLPFGRHGAPRTRDGNQNADFYAVIRTACPVAAVSLMVVLLASYLSYSLITYRTEAEQLRLHLELRTLQLDQKTQQLELYRHEVLTSHQQDLQAIACCTRPRQGSSSHQPSWPAARQPGTGSTAL